MNGETEMANFSILGISISALFMYISKNDISTVVVHFYNVYYCTIVVVQCFILFTSLICSHKNLHFRRHVYRQSCINCIYYSNITYLYTMFLTISFVVHIRKELLLLNATVNNIVRENDVTETSVIFLFQSTSTSTNQ